MNRRAMIGLLCGASMAAFTIGLTSQSTESAGADDDKYYYYSNIDVYFDVKSGEYYYYDNDEWTHSPDLPEKYLLNSWYRWEVNLDSPPEPKSPPSNTMEIEAPPAQKPNEFDLDVHERQHNQTMHRAAAG